MMRTPCSQRSHLGAFFAVLSFTLVQSGCTTPAPSPNPGGLPPEDERVARQSPCGQNVIVCTVSFPTAEAAVTGLGDQQVTETPDGFLVRGYDGDGAELVQLVGSNSTVGQGATAMFFSWSSAASDDDPCTLEPGREFSTAADPQVLLQAGFHYVRLTVTNDLAELEAVDSELCGTFTNFRRYDFVELEIEVVDAP